MGNYLSGITLDGEYMNIERSLLGQPSRLAQTHHLLLDTRNGEPTD